MSGSRNLPAANCQAPKKTLNLYGSVLSLLQSHTLFSKDCNFMCEIREKDDLRLDTGLLKQLAQIVNRNRVGYAARFLQQRFLAFLNKNFV
jgi:hypothetical protein